jgi:hypothetical protein
LQDRTYYWKINPRRTTWAILFWVPHTYDT